MHRQLINSRDLGTSKLHQIALSGDRLVLLADEDLLQVISLAKGEAEIVYSRRIGWKPELVSIAPSHRYLILSKVPREHTVVWDLQKDGPIVEKTEFVATTFARAGEHEVLIMAPKREVLEGYFLNSMTKAFSAECHRPWSFVFWYLYPTIDDRDTFFTIGAHATDGMDTLVALSFRALMVDGNAAEYEIDQRNRIHDYAGRLAVGPCGPEHVVIFRDPDGAEDSDEEDVPDVWAFRGLYIRRLHDGKLVERIEYDAPIETGAPIFATDEAVVVVCPDHLAIVPREGAAGTLTTISGKAFGIDPQHRRVALITSKGDIEIIDLSSGLSTGLAP